MREMRESYKINKRSFYFSEYSAWYSTKYLQVIKLYSMDGIIIETNFDWG